jgi:hypothetical protein
MSKYSSFKEHQLITENWRRFLKENDTPEESMLEEEEMFIKPQLRKWINDAIKAGKSFEEFVEQPGGCSEATGTWKEECFGNLRAWKYISRELKGLPGVAPRKPQSPEHIAAMKKIDRDIEGLGPDGSRNPSRGVNPVDVTGRASGWDSTSTKDSRRTSRGVNPVMDREQALSRRRLDRKRAKDPYGDRLGENKKK